MAIKTWNRHSQRRSNVTAQDITGVSVNVPLDSAYNAQIYIEHYGGYTVLNGTTVHDLIKATIEQNPKFRGHIREYCDARDEYDKDPKDFYFMQTVSRGLNR